MNCTGFKRINCLKIKYNNEIKEGGVQVEFGQKQLCLDDSRGTYGLKGMNINLEFPLWLSGLRTRLVRMTMWVQFLALLSGLRIRRCHELQCRLLWLWRRLAAIAPIQPLPWEPSYASGAVLKKTKTNKQKQKRKRNRVF